MSDLEYEGFLIVLENNSPKHVVTEPTRGANILDFVSTNNENIISEVNVGSQLG